MVSGSISYLFKLCGSIFSGWITEPLGRKKAMFFVNIPHLLAWPMLYFSNSLTEIFIAHALFGFGVGLMEAPIVTYVGEIWYVLFSNVSLHAETIYCFVIYEYSEPSIRGVITAMAGISATLGLFIVFTMGNFIAWRNVAIICLAVPVITMIAVYFVCLLFFHEKFDACHIFSMLLWKYFII